MSKFKLFVENFFVYGLGGIISKIIPLLMVPVVTRLMPNSDYYGLSDLSNTVVQFGSAIAIMGMYDAMYRLFFDKEDQNYKTSVCSTAIGFTVISSIIVFSIMLMFKTQISEFFFSNRAYAHVVYLSATATLVGATNSIISAPTRMQNKRKVFLIVNTISPLLAYSISIPMLLAGYYTIALPLAAVISGFTMEVVFFWINRHWFSFKKFNVSILWDLLKIAVPLFPNFLIYWVFNSCDKVMITNILGIGAAGIYSVGSKLGHCSQLIYTAFSGGWQFFAFSTMNEKNQVENNSKVFEYLGIVSFVCTAFVCSCSYWLFKILFTENYLAGYIVAPYLFLAPLLQMLFQVACNQFLVIKKTWPNMLILSSGALVNIAINLVLIPRMGIEGAALATLIGYFVSVVVCVITLIKMNLMCIQTRFIISAGLLLIYMISWRVLFSRNIVIGFSSALVLSCFYIFMYREELSMIFRLVKNKGI